ncbi:LON peptidase N-terminal domain and RING finger protein 1 [Grifola frondosa]|uniref:LON peptidase N-terminal domain and RING finger protein 1 n=1 Tax=Grifola frondosa TaxID=5627 RepID=A0A1C7MGN8_GRIFR|nr:LON peptidase N-terminal domain and RING finger protein 1 [Grifola frondosa]
MRARKRRRRLPRSHAPPRPPPQATDPTTNFEKELLTELNCEICFALLWQPVTTPCQHTFCSKCLHRSLDHSPACPLCRQTLPGYDYFQEHPCNKVLLAIILKAFPEAYAERGAALEAEERDARLDTPIFVCQLSFPGMPTLLHFFEPRYRLMLRRCLATPHPCFGMVPPARTAPAGGGAGNDYGTMLAIKNVRMLPDGRSLVETWGTWRFRIMERGTLDGYTVGRIERIDDYEEELDGDAEEPPVADAVRAEIGEGVELGVGGAIALTSVVAPPSAQPSAVPPPGLDACSVSRATLLPTLPRVPTNEELMAKCHAFLDQMREGTPWVVQHLNNAYVPMPNDPASFSFWMALILPIDDHEKAKLLPIRSPRLRLRLVVHWIEQLNSNWWFSGGCVVC